MLQTPIKISSKIGGLAAGLGLQPRSPKLQGSALPVGNAASKIHQQSRAAKPSPTQTDIRPRLPRPVRNRPSQSIGAGGDRQQGEGSRQQCLALRHKASQARSSVCRPWLGHKRRAKVAAVNGGEGGRSPSCRIPSTKLNCCSTV